MALALHVLRCLMSRSTELVLARGHDCCDCYDCHDCHDFWIQHDTAICQMLSCFTPTIWRVTLKMKKKRTVGSSVTKGYSPAKQQLSQTCAVSVRETSVAPSAGQVTWTRLQQSKWVDPFAQFKPGAVHGKPGKGLFECMPPVNISLFAVRWGAPPKYTPQLHPELVSITCKCNMERKSSFVISWLAEIVSLFSVTSWIILDLDCILAINCTGRPPPCVEHRQLGHWAQVGRCWRKKPKISEAKMQTKFSQLNFRRQEIQLTSSCTPRVAGLIKFLNFARLWVISSKFGMNSKPHPSRRSWSV